MSTIRNTLDRLFGLSQANTSVGTEVRAGFTTFLTMAYILFVNPMILSNAIQLPGENGFAQLMSATALAAALGTLLMGLLARYPIALAPGMGLNAFFAFSVVLGMEVPWQTALGAVFVGSLIFVVISVVGVRETIVNAIPVDLKHAMGGGIGIFLAIIGASNAGIVVDDAVTLVRLGDLTSAGPLIAIGGLFLTAILLALRVRGAIVIGILAATVMAIVSGAPVYQGKPFGGFTQGIVEAPVWPKDLFFALDFTGLLSISMIGVILSFLFVDFFDTAGTLFGISDKAGFLDSRGQLPRASKAFLSDAVATASGAVLGTSPVTSYIESAAGIEDGGRTGLTAVVVAILFLLSLFLWPIAGAVPGVATAPALIIVGAMMMGGIAKIDWNDYRTSIPAFLTVVGMPLTYSISNGIAFGIISYTVLNVITGRARQVHWILYVLSVALGFALAH